jgi:hypothetical protein
MEINIRRNPLECTCVAPLDVRISIISALRTIIGIK